MIEKQPQIRLSMQAFLNAATSGPSRRHMIAGLVSIDSPWSEYSGKTTRSMVERLRRALPTLATMRSGWGARAALVTTTGNCSCTSPITTPSGDLFNPPSPFMGRSLQRTAFALRQANPIFAVDKSLYFRRLRARLEGRRLAGRRGLSPETGAAMMARPAPMERVKGEKEKPTNGEFVEK